MRCWNIMLDASSQANWKWNQDFLNIVTQRQSMYEASMYDILMDFSNK